MRVTLILVNTHIQLNLNPFIFYEVVKNVDISHAGNNSLY